MADENAPLPPSGSSPEPLPPAPVPLEQAPLDLRERPPKDEAVNFEKEIPSASSLWAKIANPFAFWVLAVVTATMLLPLLAIYRVPGATVTERITAILDWAKTILPPVVGFGSAVVGYYFGARGSARSSNGKSDD